MPLESGEVANIADVLALINPIISKANGQGSDTIKPETFGAQHLPSLIVASDFTQWTGDENFTAETALPEPPNVDPEEVTSISTEWADSPSMVLTNAGAGYTIPRPCILVAFANIEVNGYDATSPEGSLSPEHRWAGFSLWAEIDGLTTDNGPQYTRWIRPFQVGITGGTDHVPKRCYGKTVGLLRVAYYDDSSPTLTLDELRVRYVLLQVATAGVGDCNLKSGNIGFFAIATP